MAATITGGVPSLQNRMKIINNKEYATKNSKKNPPIIPVIKKGIRENVSIFGIFVNI
jgi:hypothetical protein